MQSNVPVARTINNICMIYTKRTYLTPKFSCSYVRTRNNNFNANYVLSTFLYFLIPEAYSSDLGHINYILRNLNFNNTYNRIQ